ncbi:GHKL domain-containing protein [Fundicoccus sp. Sow4_F4]|uniref:GHKL domain-containing protein n=1 Tax=Fundicoccus sp. Sow4_F4 TaxID=3438783 RepID=UPI003F8DB53A
MIGELPDIPRVYTAFAEWMACVFYLYPLSTRIKGRKLYIGLLGALIIQIALQLIAGTFPLILWIFGIILNIIWMGVVIHFFGRTSKSHTLFLLSISFIVSELMAAFGWQIYSYFIWNRLFDHFLLEIGANFISFFLILLILYFVEKQVQTKEINIIITYREALIAGLTGIMIFIISNIGFLLSSTSYSLGYSSAIFFIRTVVNISGICILYLQRFQMKDTLLRKEVLAIENVFNSQYQQYKAYSENSLAVRRTYHDLKHQIDIIRSEQDKRKQDAYLEDMIALIDDFGSKIETGNGVLDTILTRKNLYCKQNDIQFSCIVDGKILTGMNIMDICSLFGNAIDNAIEYVEKIPDLEKRVVNLRVTNVGQMIVLRLENFLIDEIDFRNGIPSTSKQDKETHGYGLKSIKYITNKYDGSMSIKSEGHWFILKVLIPLSAATIKANLEYLQ